MEKGTGSLELQPDGTDSNPQTELVRGIGLRDAIALNVNNMIGVGPFITLPLVILAMQGPQAILGWVLGAVLTLCDGLVWAELGAAMPEAGGSYFFLKKIYGENGLGRYVSFLYIWQLTFSAPLSIASGCVGLAQYAGYLFPSLRKVDLRYELPLHIPFAGIFHVAILLGPATLVAMLCCALAVALLYRNVQSTGRVSQLLLVGVMLTLGSIIVAGLTHFNAHQAFDFPPGAFHPGPAFFEGLGAAMLIATYDYWGAYNICFVGSEVRQPGRTIPRAILWSIMIVAALYLLMNISVLGVIPWQTLTGSAGTNARLSVVAVFMQKIYGSMAGRIIALLVIWAAFASVYSLLLGYSRVPYAAALDGNYFRALTHVHPKHKFPNRSLLLLGGVSILFCTLQLIDLVAALVVIRIILQFLLQQVGLIVLRFKRPDLVRPFRVWLYPLPPVLACIGFLYILFARPEFQRELFYAFILVVAGSAIYLARAYSRKEWPFRRVAAREIL